VLAALRGQPIGDQHQGAIAQRRCIAAAASGEPVERRLKSEFAPDMAGHQHWPPVPRRNRLHVLAPNPAVGCGIAVQQAHQLVQVEMGRQQVAPPEIENGAVPRLASLPIGFDHAHVFVLDALAAGRPNHPQEHGFLRNLPLPISTGESDNGNCKQCKNR